MRQAQISMQTVWVQPWPKPVFSAVKMTKVVEDNHNSKVADALLTKQCLEKASAEAIESMMDAIWAACTPADMWQIEKRISACISLQRAKAYNAMVEQYRPEPKPHQDKEGSEGTSTLQKQRRSFISP